MIESLGLDISAPTVIFEDNQGAISLYQKYSSHSRTKHIDIRHHFVTEAVEKGQVNLKYLPSEHVAADILTKGLPKLKFVELRTSLGLRSKN